MAVGTEGELAGLIGNDTVRIDAGGRRVIPGLIDSHIHMVRAGLRWAKDVRWEGLESLEEALGRLTSAALESPAGAWVVVLGGWHPHQFTEKRVPTLTELDKAVPDHPVYIQRNYQEAFLNGGGLRTAGLGDPATGRVAGMGALQACRALLDQPSPEQQIEGTRSLLAELGRLGLTGVIDAAGFGVTSSMYEPIEQLWRSGALGLRVRLLLGPSQRGREAADIRSWIEGADPGYGDGWLKYLGFGEVVLFDAHDGEGVVSVDVRDQADRLREMSRVIIEAGWPIHIHAILDSSVDMVLDAWSPLIGEYGPGHRLTITHADQISGDNLRRVRELGIGIPVQHGMAYRGLDSLPTWGAPRVASSPPIGEMLGLGIPMGAGTDATVVADYNPWRCLCWLVSGEAVDGSPVRSEAHRLNRAEALSLYTSGSAWFSSEEDQRGVIKAGYLADLAILSDDYFSVSERSIPSVSSLLTMVGGRIVHRSPQFGG
ncbi:MAG TPA: amidohydrolase family protein [Acidimicrobiia bacterium]|nr:amidohydrolase family protein [Acidimicrobiia bacterium]